MRNFTDRSGGRQLWERKGEKVNHYLEDDIVNHHSQGWTPQMVQIIRDEEIAKVRNEKNSAMEKTIYQLCLFKIFNIYYFLFFIAFSFHIRVI